MISEWWTYSIADFLLFSPRAYYALIERYNHDIWPWHAVAAAIGVAIVMTMVRPSRGRIRLAAVLLGSAWIWIAWGFFWERYVTINWAATWLAAAFALQGLLLFLFAAAGSGTQAHALKPGAGFAATCLVVFALTAYPLVAPIMGRGWHAAELVGIAADPTAIATLAWLAVSASGLARWGLFAIPALWCAMTGTTLWALGTSDFFLAPACALVAIAVASLSAR